MPQPHRIGVAQEFPTQRERAAAVEAFNRQMEALPFVIGDAFYRWADEPTVVNGRTEIMNWGLVDRQNRPHESVVKSMGRR